jgi:Tfp pilus assembly protein PilO
MEDKRKEFGMSDLIIPVGSLIAVVLIVIFVLVPWISQTYQNINDIKDIKNKQAILKTNAQYLSSLDFEELKADSKIMMTSIPEDREVAQVAEYVDSVAKKFNMNMELISASNTIEQENNKILITVPITYVGKYDDIVNFLKYIQIESPYAIDISSLDMKKSEYDMWRIKLTVVMYQMRKNAEVLTQEAKRERIYLPISSYNQDKAIIDLIEQKNTPR